MTPRTSVLTFWKEVKERMTDPELKSSGICIYSQVDFSRYASTSILTKTQHYGLMGWLPRALAVLLWVVELDDSRKHHACRFSFCREVRFSLLEVSNVDTQAGL